MTATIDRAALRHNVRVLQDAAAPADLMAVVKADAYGHGAVPTARVLHDEGVRHFAVARLAEGRHLREASLPETRILVLGAPFPDQLPAYADARLDVTVSSEAVARAVLEQAARASPFRVHLKVDTGMTRLGVSPDDAPSWIARLTDAEHVTLAGLWTHFATADTPGSSQATTQMDRFEAMLADVPEDVLAGVRVHVANTGALLTLQDRVTALPSPLVRTGISLYGLAASPGLAARADVRLVMKLTARVTHLQTIEPGTSVSYGATWTADRPTRLATLGVGYGDGYPRLGSGRASVWVGQARRPVVGTICMDMCMVDLGPPDGPVAQRVQVGDDAVLFAGDRRPDVPTPYDVSDWAETIPYEICCGVSPRVPRRYVG